MTPTTPIGIRPVSRTLLRSSIARTQATVASAPQSKHHGGGNLRNNKQERVGGTPKTTNQIVKQGKRVEVGPNVRVYGREEVGMHRARWGPISSDIAVNGFTKTCNAVKEAQECRTWVKTRARCPRLRRKPSGFKALGARIRTTGAIASDRP